MKSSCSRLSLTRWSRLLWKPTGLHCCSTPPGTISHPHAASQPSFISVMCIRVWPFSFLCTHPSFSIDGGVETAFLGTRTGLMRLIRYAGVEKRVAKWVIFLCLHHDSSLERHGSSTVIAVAKIFCTRKNHVSVTHDMKIFAGNSYYHQIRRIFSLWTISLCGTDGQQRIQLDDFYTTSLQVTTHKVHCILHIMSKFMAESEFPYFCEFYLPLTMISYLTAF